MAISYEKVFVVHEKYAAIKDCLNEKGRRLWAAVEAQSNGAILSHKVPLYQNSWVSSGVGKLNII